MTDELEFTTPAPDPARPERPPRKCRRHDWVVRTGTPDCDVLPPHTHASCSRCGRDRDEAGSRRGRNNRKRGTSDEAEVARILGGRKVGPMSWPWDV
ncbi:MAG: hypothetical protein WAV64_01925, partial [Candidatus Moraniibacteriota bacterium]